MSNGLDLDQDTFGYKLFVKVSMPLWSSAYSFIIIVIIIIIINVVVVVVVVDDDDVVLSKSLY